MTSCPLRGHAHAFLTAVKGSDAASFMAHITCIRACLEVRGSWMCRMFVNWPATHCGIDRSSYNKRFLPFEPWYPSLGHLLSGGLDTVSKLLYLPDLREFLPCSDSCLACCSYDARILETASDTLGSFLSESTPGMMVS